MFKYLVIYTFFYVCACFAQIVNPVTIDVTSDSLVRAGEVVNIEVSAKMEKQWKIYSIYKIVDGPLPTEINFKGDIINEIGKVIEPEPIEEYDPGFDVTSFYHKGNTLFSSQALLKDDLPPGNYEISVMTYYQVCNERLCYPPVEKKNVVKIKVEPGEPRIEKTTLTSLGKNHIGKNSLSSFLNLIIIYPTV